MREATAFALILAWAGAAHIALGADLNLHGTESVIIESGDEYQDVYLFDHARLTMYGGHIRNRLYLHNSSTATIYGGSARVLCVYPARAYADIYGGHFEWIEGGPFTVYNASCEKLETSWAVEIHKIQADYLLPTQPVNLYAVGQIMTTGGTYGDGYVMGQWLLDGTSFVLDLKDTGQPGDPAAATWINLVPEPATLALLALGGLALIRRRR